MKFYRHTLTELELACGVTLDDVADMLIRVTAKGDGDVVFPAHTSAALASSTARCVHSGKACKFAGLNGLGMPVYRPA